MPIQFSKYLRVDPQRNYKFRTTIIPPSADLDSPEEGVGLNNLKNQAQDLAEGGISGAAGAVANEAKAAVSAGARDPIVLTPDMIESTTIPSFSFEVEKVPYKGGTFKHPSKSSKEEIEITFKENAKGDVVRSLKNWRELVNRNGGFGLPSEYESTILIQLTSGFQVVHTTVKAVSCWPTNTGSIELSYDESDQVKVTQTFQTQSITIDIDGLLDTAGDLLSGDLSGLNIPGANSTPSLGGVFQ